MQYLVDSSRVATITPDLQQRLPTPEYATETEKDCIKMKPKEWLDKKDWREIHDILRVQGFNWLANGKDSCWIKVT